MAPASNSTSMRTPRVRRLEIASAILLAIATTVTAWCAYQASLWSGRQTFQLAASNAAAREAMRLELELRQQEGFDGVVLLHYVDALVNNEPDVAQFYYERLRGEVQQVLHAWLATDPLNNQNALPHPLAMPEYQSAQEQQARHMIDLAASHLAQAHRANRTADDYILLTVLLAMVLFFGGLSTLFDVYWMRATAFTLAVVVFLVVVALGVSYPVALHRP